MDKLLAASKTKVNPEMLKHSLLLLLFSEMVVTKGIYRKKGWILEISQ